MKLSPLIRSVVHIGSLVGAMIASRSLAAMVSSMAAWAIDVALPGPRCRPDRSTAALDWAISKISCPKHFSSSTAWALLKSIRSCSVFGWSAGSVAR